MVVAYAWFCHPIVIVADTNEDCMVLNSERRIPKCFIASFSFGFFNSGLYNSRFSNSKPIW